MQNLTSNEGGPSTYTREIIDSVWSEAELIDGNDSELWRKDETGTWIHRLDYGKRSSDFGWEIREAGGRLSPLHWQNLSTTTVGRDADDDDDGMMDLFAS